jgi:N6-adenosine-specific RNA methylase IME4
MKLAVAAPRGLPSVERARELLASCNTHGEVRRIKAIAQAVATLERGREVACDAGEIIVAADKRHAELTAEERTTRTKGRPKKGAHRATLSTAAKHREKRRAPLLHLSAADERRYFQACRRQKQPPTTSGAVALARLEPAVRAEVLETLSVSADVAKAIGVVKIASRRAHAEHIRHNPIVTPEGAYQVLVADPPWPYEARSDDTTHRGRSPYPDMTLDEIRALPVSRLAQPSAVLWLWTTNAFMREAYTCLDAWGFEGKTILTWDKGRLGLGNWLRNVTEHAILAVRGRPVVQLTNQSTLIRDVRGAHSQKPEAFYKLVEELCPGSKLELFSRTDRPGWTAWGAETGTVARRRIG